MSSGVSRDRTSRWASEQESPADRPEQIVTKGDWERFLVTFRLTAYYKVGSSNESAQCTLQVSILGFGLEDALQQAHIVVDGMLSDDQRRYRPEVVSINREV